MNNFHIDSKYEFCPNGNYWQEVSGIFDKEIYLFCDCKECKGQVYVLRPVNITEKVEQEQIDRFRKYNKLEEIRSKINLDNLEKIEKFLN